MRTRRKNCAHLLASRKSEDVLHVDGWMCAEFRRTKLDILVKKC